MFDQNLSGEDTHGNISVSGIFWGLNFNIGSSENGQKIGWKSFCLWVFICESAWGVFENLRISLIWNYDPVFWDLSLDGEATFQIRLVKTGEDSIAEVGLTMRIDVLFPIDIIEWMESFTIGCVITLKLNT